MPTFRLAAPVAAGELASFDASGSIDPEGGPLTFRWSFGDGGVGDGEAVGHPFAVAGAYRVVLVVTDASGATGTALGSVEVGPGRPDDELAGIEIAGGAPVTARPDVSVAIRGPPGAARAELANAADFAGAVRVAAAGEVPWRLDDAGPDGPRQVFVRFLADGGHPLPGFDRAGRVDLDRTAPALGRARARQTRPVLVCAPGGRAVAGTSRRRVPLAIRAVAADRLSGLRGLEARSPLSPPTAVGEAPWSLPARPGGSVEVRAVDRAGKTLRRGSPCASPRPPSRSSTGAHARSRGPRPARRRIRGPSSGGSTPCGARPAPPAATGPGYARSARTTWTVYSGQGLFPNWVHAATELNGRLGHGSVADYRAAASEIVAMSTLDAPAAAATVSTSTASPCPRTGTRRHGATR